MNRHCEKCEYRHEANERSPGFICDCPCHKPTDKETSGVFICRTKDTTGGEETHSACQKRIKEEGGKARCCYCVSHKNCEINSTPKTPYNQRDHSHCWESKEPPCGLKGTHRCCLCELPAPKVLDWVDKTTDELLVLLNSLIGKDLFPQILKMKLREATQRGREQGIKESNSGRLMYQRSRDEVLKEALEIVETKLKNDPRNPVLLAGLQYPVVVLKSIKE